jgi:hypothetical protein
VSPEKSRKLTEAQQDALWQAQEGVYGALDNLFKTLRDLGLHEEYSPYALEFEFEMLVRRINEDG